MRALDQAILFATLLAGLGAGYAGCWFVFWKPLLASFLH